MCGGAWPDMLTIPETLRQTVMDHCRSRYPKEACGLLAATRPDGPIVQVYPMRNVEDSPIGYGGTGGR